MRGGVERILLSYPAVTADKTIVVGANHEEYDPSQHRIISDASCTTKSLAVPLRVILNEGYSIDSMDMLTVHAATATQKVLDVLDTASPHTTGAAKALELVIPELKGRTTATSVRIPTKDGSISYRFMDIDAPQGKELTTEGLNALFTSRVCDPRYEGRFDVLPYADVSADTDIVGRPENALIIASETNVRKSSAVVPNVQRYRVKLVSGYDNELGSITDLIRLLQVVDKRSK